MGGKESKANFYVDEPQPQEALMMLDGLLIKDSERFIPPVLSYVESLLTELRDRETSLARFRTVIQALTPYLLLSIMPESVFTRVQINTPDEVAIEGVSFRPKASVFCLGRSSLTMGLAAINSLPPGTSLGWINTSGDGRMMSAEVTEYNLPSSVQGQRVILLDAVNADGSQFRAGFDLLSLYGEDQPEEVIVGSLVAAPLGIKRTKDKCPEVKIFTVALDKRFSYAKSSVHPGIGNPVTRQWGEGTVDPLVLEICRGSLAQLAGFDQPERIVSVNSRP